MSEFKLELSSDFAGKLFRRHNGNKNRTKEEIKNMKQQFEKLYKRWCSYRKKYDYLVNVWWEERKVEDHYGEPLFYYAHRKLKRYEKIIHECHEKLFYRLTYFDGNNGEKFDPFYCIDVISIMYDFKHKYLNNRCWKFLED